MILYFMKIISDELITRFSLIITPMPDAVIRMVIGMASEASWSAMNISKWKVGYIEDGIVKYQNIWWKGQPGERDAAVLIKARVLEEQRASASPLESNKTVALSRYHGIEIVDIEPADELLSSETSRILVVDDNKDARETLVAVLQIWNHSVEEAEDGLSCLAIASTSAPDVILLDIGMPNMNGYEVAKQLRKLPQLNRTRIIAVTAYGSHMDKQRAEEAGFDAHFTKPVALEILRYQLFPKSAVADTRH